jgi:hypothetical protein
MNPTSSVKIYEQRNTTYQLGEELIFRIPPSVIAMNPLETHISCHLEVGTTLNNMYALNKQIGAEALVRELTILNGSESSNLEQITSYSRLKRVLCFYGNNKTDDNLVKLMSGGQDLSPIHASNRLFDKANTGAVTQKKIEVMFKLSLSGIFSATKPFPTMLTDGLVVKILLENDINKILERMSEQTVGRSPDPAPVSIKDFFKRPIGTNDELCYQVAVFGNDVTNPATGLQANTHVLINRKGAANITGGVTDNSCIEGGNYQVSDATPTVENCPFAIGQAITFLKADSSNGVQTTIEGIAITGAGADARWDLTFASVDTSNATSGTFGAGITTKICIHEEGQPAIGGLSGNQPKSTLTISNLHLVLGTINLAPQEISKLQSAASSNKGYAWDYHSYVDYAVNITKALVNSLYIPCKLNRTKSILSFWEDVGSATDGSRDNLLPIVDANTVCSQYNYKINNLIVPNRVVGLTNYNRQPNISGRWEAIALTEMEKAIEQAGQQVKSLEDIANCLVVGRQLALYNHTYDMSSAKGETRLELQFTTQTRDLLIHNFVAHLRRLIITPNSTFVEM